MRSFPDRDCKRTSRGPLRASAGIHRCRDSHVLTVPLFHVSPGARIHGEDGPRHAGADASHHWASDHLPPLQHLPHAVLPKGWITLGLWISSLIAAVMMAYFVIHQATGL